MTAGFGEPPPSAAWQHRDARDGFETVFPSRDAAGSRLEGWTAAVEDGVAWVVRYAIVLDERWLTREARVRGRSPAGEREVRLEADGRGRWHVDGVPRPDLDGCLDVDLESSACTNMLPVRRLRLEVGARAEAPAASVTAPGLDVRRLEQTYVRLDDDGPRRHYAYAAPRLGFESRLVYDESGLVLDYPGIARRVA